MSDFACYGPVPKRLVLVEDVTHVPVEMVGYVCNRMIKHLVAMTAGRSILRVEEFEFISDPEMHRYLLRKCMFVEA